MSPERRRLPWTQRTLAGLLLVGLLSGLLPPGPARSATGVTLDAPRESRPAAQVVPTPTPTVATTPSPTRTPTTPAATATLGAAATPGAAAAPGRISPRITCSGNVQVISGTGGYVEVTARQGGAVQQLAFTSFDNAYVTIASQLYWTQRPTPNVHTATPPSTVFGFTITAVVSGQPSTVHFTVTDGCDNPNPWPTFAGAGLGAPVPTATPATSACLPAEAIPPGTDRNPPYVNGSAAGGVHTLTGAFSTSDTDVSMAGRGPTAQFTRVYNSNDTSAPTYPIGLGPGWTHSYATRLVRPADAPPGNQDLVLVGPQGRRDRYVHTGNPIGTFAPPPGVFTRMQRQGDGSYLVTHQDQSKWVFGECGRLIQLHDPYGNLSQLTYESATGRLLSIGDPAGRAGATLALAYDIPCGTGRLCTVSDGIGRAVRFSYDGASRLQTVQDRIAPPAGPGVTTYFYDAQGRLATIQNANLHTVLTNVYDPGTGRVTTQRDVFNNTTTFSYTASGAQPTGAIVTYPPAAYQPAFPPTTQDTYYATTGWLQSTVSHPASGEAMSVSYGYDDQKGTRTSVTDAIGHTTTYCYDVDYTGFAIDAAISRGNLTRRIASPSGPGASQPTTLYQYDSHNNLLQEVPPRGVNTTSLTVTCATNLTGVWSSNYATDRTYDASNQLLSLTRRYTDAGSLITSTTRYEYNSSPPQPGRVTREIPPRGNVGAPDDTYAIKYAYYPPGDPQAGLLASVTTPSSVVAYPNGDKVTYFYDGVGRKTSMVDAMGNTTGGFPAQHTWTWNYDNEDRLLSQASPPPIPGASTSLVTSYQYDLTGNKTASIDPRGQYTRYAYDERELLLLVSQSATQADPLFPTPDPQVLQTGYLYDAQGNRRQVSKRQGGATIRTVDYLHDGLKRLRQESEHPTGATGLTRTYFYDDVGNLVRLQKPNGSNEHYGYDWLNRLTAMSYSAGPSTPAVTYTYDAQGNRLSMQDGTGTTSYAYDESNQLTSVTYGAAGGQTVGYRYDRDGNRAILIYPPNAQPLTYNRDKSGRVSQLVDWASRITSYGYRADGKLASSTQVNGTTLTRTYDMAGRPFGVTHALSTGSWFLAEGTTLDQAGNPINIDGSASVVPGCPAQWYPLNYGFDRLNRLTLEDQPSGSSFLDQRFGYDAANNRATYQVGSTTPASYTYDGADRLTLVSNSGGVTDQFVPDSNGNTIQRQFGGQGQQTYTYDAADRLVRIQIPNKLDTAFTYDGDSRRASRQVGGTGATVYLDDVSGSMPQLLHDGTFRYVYGPGGIAYATGVDGATVSQVFHLDRQGSLRTKTSMTQAILWTGRYEPYGLPREVCGPLDPTPVGYTSAQHEGGDAQFIHLGARWYDPRAGRFMSRDTEFGDTANPGSLNRYTYALNNPLVFTDPSGHYPEGDNWASDPYYNTPRNWGCGPYFPGCLFGLREMNDLAWSIDAGFGAWFGAGRPLPPANLQYPLTGFSALGIPSSSGAALHDRVMQLAGSLGRSEGFVTVGGVLARTPQGRYAVVVATSEQEVRDAIAIRLRTGEITATGIGHAEETAISAALRAGWQPLQVAASRPYCQEYCIPAIIGHGVTPVSPWPFP